MGPKDKKASSQNAPAKRNPGGVATNASSKPSSSSTHPPKAKAAAASSHQMEDVKRDIPLQAILLADSFSKTFRPLTHSRPKVLLPLVNVPMIEYTLEFLASNGVKEVFVFCVWHAAHLQKFINESKWNSLLTIKCITSNSCLSAGEALREIDSLGIIRSDPFILISGTSSYFIVFIGV